MFIIRRIFKLLLRIVILAIAISAGLVLLFKWIAVPFTPLMVIRSVEQKSAGEKLFWRHEWVPLDQISDQLELAVVCAEDQNFLEHSGFDWGAIEKALEHNEDSRRLRGGSTISQQTAKNVFLWPGRSYVRKGFEAWFTLLIELFWSKERIMEVYLNSIEMGKGIYGAQAAAEYWFRKPAAKLTADEAAALAAILPNPRKYSANPPGPYIAKRKNWVRKQMRLWGNRLDYTKYNGKEQQEKPTKNK